jgi:hypothetical protein
MGAAQTGGECFNANHFVVLTMETLCSTRTATYLKAANYYSHTFY